MIPVRLELKNFMSYGEQVTPLDFTGIRLACLSGDNGHGKSALLDAITWALWGKARVQQAEELIRLGAEEMRVVFDFRLGDDLYRVIRGYSKRSGSVCEIYIAESADLMKSHCDSDELSGEFKPSASDIKWRPLTGQGVRDTTRIIERILHMDYKTFINSAYIQQGKADEFTKQTPTDRKKILADILDLSRYDLLEQKAKDRRNQADQRIAELEREIASIEQELQNEEIWKSELVLSKSEHERLESEIRDKEALQRSLQTQKTKLEESMKRIGELTQQIATLRSEIENLKRQQVEQERRIDNYRMVLQRRNEILAGLEKLRSVRDRLTQLDENLKELRILENKKTAIERAIIEEKHKLDIERQSLSKEIAELQSKITESEKIEQQAAVLRKQVEELDRLDNQRACLRSIVTEESERWSSLKTQNDNLRRAKADLEEKLRLISQPGAKCPLCRTELGEDKHQQIIKDYEQEIADIDRQIEEVRIAGINSKNKRDNAQAELERIENELKNGQSIRARLAQAEQVLFQAEQYRKQLPEVQRRLDTIVQRIENEDFAHESRAELREICAKIAALEYDPEIHRELKREFEQLQLFESESHNLKHAEDNLPGDEANLQNIKKLIASREKSIIEAESMIESLQTNVSELENINAQLDSVQDSLRSLRETERDLIGRIATLEKDLLRCQDLKVGIAEKKKALERAKRDKSIYSELVTAFGKKGVQALIIENAIPEIQEEANRILARMTDNAMQIAFETLRDKKTGGTEETLDIKVSDDMGTRSYDLYSGGEAFRINFALRVALSKLLARRAGARLQTLIIDEGFGTQDGKGREKLIDAINSVKDDFEMILVITHIDELKEAFPTRIEIVKDFQGSQISIN
jgi:exonuclease SbcC